MSPFVRDMHTANGLLKRVRQSRMDVLAAERALLERVAGWCPFPAVLCGNSVNQDKRFLDRYMPGLAGFLHYRVLDVTTVKLLAQAWYGESAVYVKPEAGAHDALVDIKNSIAELEYYRKTLFR
jgi:oligoribonuclease